MTQAVRQDNLFSAENWQAVYQSFRNADFKAYDFDTLRSAMVDYIRLSYPENFNDWIQSSEFVALIDLIAFLGQNLAFRVDLNSRENFIDTAERRDSVLKLARFLSYNPKRNIAASGLLKIKAIKTTETVFDTMGQSLSNKLIQWVNVNDPDNYEKFITVLNAAMNPSHKFGNPVKAGTVDGVTTQQYALSSVTGDIVTIGYTANVSGTDENFEITNSDFIDNQFFKESVPNPYSTFNLLYRNNNAGNTSPDTGFFVLFKQGQLTKSDFQINDYVENRVIDLDIPNINESDVFVQSVNGDGSVIETWDKVPNVSGNNVIYNSYARGVRKIYSVITREDDKISIKFGDGLFSDVPMGIIRVWTRKSNALSYVIKPVDMKNITWDSAYYDAQGRQQYLTIVADLEYSVNNSSPAESMTSIKRNAPLAYSTQDRMVTGEDYTVYPLTQSADVLKVKAVNRVHSGFSRYKDSLDPTGTYQSIDMLADDMYMYKQNDYVTTTLTVTNKLYIRDIVQQIERKLTAGGTVNFYYANYPYLAIAGNDIMWNTVGTAGGSCTGYFTKNGRIISVGTREFDAALRQMVAGALIEFSSGDWAAITSISLSGLGMVNAKGVATGLKSSGEGCITLSKNIKSGVIASKIIPSYKKRFSLEEAAAIKEQLTLKNNFAIRYDNLTQTYKIVTADNINVSTFYSTANAGNEARQNLDASWIYYITFQDDKYIVRQKTLNYVIGSDSKLKFGNINFLDGKSNAARADKIKFLKINTKSDNSGILGSPIEFLVATYFTNEDGYTDSGRVVVKLADVDSNYLPDDPYAFERLIGDSMVNITSTTSTNGTMQTSVVESTAGALSGRTDLIAQWQHIAESNQRIDPAMVNIIDMFVLSANYDTEYRRWIKTDGSAANRPLPPTTVAMNQQFANLELVKTSSDTIIFRPAKYKLLFGKLADAEFQAKFKVIKMPGTSLNDNEIKSKVVAAIDSFFDISNWSFGETFYFTELAAYIHTMLSGSISSVVIVPVIVTSTFGKLFQVPSSPDELFANCATVNDIDIISQITDTNIRIGK
jgi:hypothetical protein